MIYIHLKYHTSQQSRRMFKFKHQRLLRNEACNNEKWSVHQKCISFIAMCEPGNVHEYPSVSLNKQLHCLYHLMMTLAIYWQLQLNWNIEHKVILVEVIWLSQPGWFQKLQNITEGYAYAPRPFTVNMLCMLRVLHIPVCNAYIARYIAKCQRSMHINIIAMYPLQLLHIAGPVIFILSAADQASSNIFLQFLTDGKPFIKTLDMLLYYAMLCGIMPNIMLKNKDCACMKIFGCNNLVSYKVATRLKIPYICNIFYLVATLLNGCKQIVAR